MAAVAAYAIYEVGSAAYDVYQAGKTLLDKDASLGRKGLMVGLAAASVVGPGGGYAAAADIGLSFTRRQLQHAFDHAPDFGVIGNASNKTLAAFSNAVQSHVDDVATKAIRGTYRGRAVTHHVNPSTRLNVIRDATTGEFISGWKLSAKQLEHVLDNGKLGGGP